MAHSGLLRRSFEVNILICQKLWLMIKIGKKDLSISPCCDTGALNVFLQYKLYVQLPILGEVCPKDIGQKTAFQQKGFKKTWWYMQSAKVRVAVIVGEHDVLGVSTGQNRIVSVPKSKISVDLSLGHATSWWALPVRNDFFFFQIKLSFDAFPILGKYSYVTDVIIFCLLIWCDRVLICLGEEAFIHSDSHQHSVSLTSGPAV